MAVGAALDANSAHCPDCGGVVRYGVDCRACGTTFPLLAIHRGEYGWCGDYGTGRSTIHGYGDGWQNQRLHPRAVVVDTSTIPLAAPAGRDRCTFAIAGPIGPVPDVEPGHLRGLSRTERFDPAPLADRPDHCARLGSARGLHHAAVDVYARLAAAFGARVTFACDGRPIDLDPEIEAVAWDLYRAALALRGTAPPTRSPAPDRRAERH
jgi:hypothetical protein